MIIIDGRSFFDLPIINALKTYDNTRKITAGLEIIKQIAAY